MSALENIIGKHIKEIPIQIEHEARHDAADFLKGVGNWLHKAEEFLEPSATKAPATNAPATNAPAHAHDPAVPAAVSQHPTVGYGSTGAAVAELQKALGVHVDGIDGAATTAALKTFQRNHGLRPDGIAGEKTWAALEPTVHEGARGDAVRRIQAEVGVTVDGVDGPRTNAAVKQYQQAHGLKPDGVVGAQTWKAINGPAEHPQSTNAAPARDHLPAPDPRMPQSDIHFSSNAPYLKGGYANVQYGGVDRAIDRGYQQSGEIESVKDGIVTQHIGKGTAKYHLADLINSAKDQEAMKQLLAPGRNIQVSITPDGIHVEDLDRHHNRQRAQDHSR